MRTLPFPFPLNTGTDIVHIPRIHRLITTAIPTTTTTKRTRSSTSSTPIISSSSLDRFTRRILHDSEQRHFRSRFPHLNLLLNLRPEQGPNSDPDVNVASRLPAHQTQTMGMARWLAGRFAAKEAARKAAPGGAASVGWKDVVVRIDGEASGRPEVVYLWERDGDGEMLGQVGRLSISHDGEYVVATVLAAGEIKPGE